MAHADCLFCGARLPRNVRGNGPAVCDACRARAIDRQQDVRRELPRIRSELSRLGISLTGRVKVDLVESGELQRIPGATVWTQGVTVWRQDPRTNTSQIRIGIAAGLPFEAFAMTVGHEAGHAWLVQRGAKIQHSLVEEGFCNTISAAWAKQHGTDLALRLRAALALDPDPVYGDGYRLVRDSMRRHGVRQVVDQLLSTGTLP